MCGCRSSHCENRIIKRDIQNTKYTEYNITKQTTTNKKRMSDDKRDVSQSPVLLESNKSLSEDKAPTTTNTKGPPPGFENASVPEREIAKESPSTKKTEKTDDLQPHEELYHWKKPIRSAGVLGAGCAVYYFLFIQGYTFMTLLGFTLLFNLFFNGCVKLLFKPLTYLGVVDEKSQPEKYFVYVNEIVKDVFTSTAFTKIFDSVKASVVIYDKLIKEAMMVVDGPSTTKAVLAFYGLRVVGSMFELATIGLLFLLSLFTLPIVYKKYGKEIDTHYEKISLSAVDIVRRTSEKTVEAVPQLESTLTTLGLVSTKKEQ